VENIPVNKPKGYFVRSDAVESSRIIKMDEFLKDHPEIKDKDDKVENKNSSN
jgi:hypothetical protein